MAKENSTLKLLSDTELLDQFELAIRKDHYDPIGDIQFPIDHISNIQKEILDRMLLGVPRYD